MRRLDPQRDIRPAASEWILASSSPRRRELLAAAGQSFEVLSSRVDEAFREGETAASAATRLATEKALEVASRATGRWVLGADTVVVVDERILGKPVDADEARAMLESLSGREHRVITGFALVDPAGRVAAARAIETLVAFVAIEREAIDAYVRSGEPLDKAGAYAIQGGAAEFVREIRGSWTNVVGLPMDEVEEALRRAGIWRSAPERRAE
jgi:septum formation protein